MDIDTFTRRLDEMVDEVPPPLLEGLSGGVVVQERARRRRGDPPGVYLLGEYVTDDFLGSFIVIYYGSFRRLFAGEPARVWEEELWETLRHELRHHVESRAGVSDLDREDMRQLQQLWEQWEQSRKRPSGPQRPRPGGPSGPVREGRDPRTGTGSAPGSSGAR